MAGQAISMQKKSEYYPNLAKKEAYGIASNYDAAKEAKPAIDAAKKSGADMLGAAMSGNKAKFSAMGGTPGGDTAFSLKQLSTIKNYTDPMEMFTAQLLANASQTKINMLSQIFGGNTVSPAAQMMFAGSQGADFTGGLNLLSQSLGKLNIGGGGKSGVQGPNASTPFYH